MVFENLVADLLTKYLGDYVKNLNKDQLKIGIFGGNVVLNNLELKQEALADLNLPITVKKGFLGKLELNVPWRNLKNQPVVVYLDRVFLLACKQTTVQKYDEEAEKKAALEAKLKKVESYELMKSFKSQQTGDSSKGGDKFTDRLVTKIIDNLQVVINKVHIRYEDEYNGQTFALGITLDKIAVQSTDASWKPAFLDIANFETRHKLAEMNNLSVYLDTTTRSLDNLSMQEMSDVFNKLIPVSKTSHPEHQFLISPISAFVKLKMHKNEKFDKNIPKIVMDCVFNEVALSLDKPQYTSVLQLLQLVNNFARDLRYLKHRPSKSVKEAPRAWWKFACAVILDDVREQRKRKSWAFILTRRDARKNYVRLYKRKQPAKWLVPLTKEEVAELDKLEVELSYEDIIYFRSLADAEIKREAKNAQQREEYEKTKLKPSGTSGFFKSIFGSKTKTEEELALERAAPKIELSNEQREELYRTIGYDDVVADAVLPKDYVQTVVKLDLKAISFQIVNPATKTALMKGVLDAINMTLQQRPDSMKVQAGIRSLEVMDCATANTLFPKLISPSAHTKSKAKQSALDNSADDFDGFCNVNFETNPPDAHADAVVSLKMAPLDVVVNKSPLALLASFFKMDDEVDLSTLTTKATEQLANLRELTMAQLQVALASHKTMDLKVNIKAPTVIVPQYYDKPDTPILVVDLGNFTVESDLTKNTIKQSQDFDEDDYYDKFYMAMTNTKVLLAKHNQDWRDVETQRRSKMHLIEDFDIKLHVKNSIQPANMTLTTLKVSGELPKLKVNFSTVKYAKLMALLDSLAASSTTAVASTPQAQGSIVAATSASTQVVDVSDEKENEKKKVQKDPKYQQLMVEHASVDATFAVTNVSICLTRQVSSFEDDELDLIKLNMVGLTAKFRQRTYDMSASLVLQKIYIEDCMELSSEFKYLASSSLNIKDLATPNDILIMIDYMQTQRESPEYANLDMSINFVFNSFFVVCNPDTVAALLDFAMKCAPPKSPTAPTPALPAASASATAPVAPEAGKVGIPRKAKPIIKIKLDAKVNTLGLLLNQSGGRKLAQFSIEGTTAQLILKENSMRVTGKVWAMQLIDCTSQGPYRKLVSLKDENVSMMEFDYATFSELEDDYPGWDTEVQAKLRSIRIVAMYGYIMKLKNYFSGPMLAPIMAPAASTISSATSSTLQQMQQIPVSENIKRMKLDISMDTPVIIVPENARSSSILQLELGHLTIANAFQIAPVGDLPLEILTVALSSMNIQSIHDGSTYQILDKVTMDVTIQRILVPMQNQLPQQRVTVRMSPLEFLLAEAEYKFLYGMLNSVTQQLAEDAAPVPSTPQAQLPTTTATPSSPQQALTNKSPTEEKELVYHGTTQTELLFELTQVAFEIRYGEGRLEEESLATFEINEIKVTLQLSADSVMKVNLSLQSVLLNDTRIGNNKFPQLLGYRGSEAENPPPQITMLYVRDSISGAQAIRLALDNPFVFASPSALFAIKDFFMNVFPPAETVVSPASPQSSNTQAVATATAQPTTFPPIHATISINNPEILLVEDEKQEDTRAMVVKLSVNVAYARRSDGKESASVTAKKTNIFVFQPKRSGESAGEGQGIRPIPILNPFDISINYNKWPRASTSADQHISNQRILIDLQPVEFFFSYQDFKLVNVILHSLKLTSEPKTTPPPPTKPALRSSDSFLENSQQSLPIVNIVDPETISAEQLQVTAHSVCVTLINDLHGRNVPFSEVRMADLRVDLKGWSTLMKLQAGMTITVDYFNTSLNIFEPLLEYWTFVFQMNYAVDPKMQLKLTSDQFLNLNITHAFVNTMSDTYQILSNDYYKNAPAKQSPSASPNPSIAPSPKPSISPFTSPKSPLPTLLHSPSMSNSRAKDMYVQNKFRPYWIVNMTGKSLEYRLEVQERMDDAEGQAKPASTTGGKVVVLEDSRKRFIDLTGSSHQLRNFRQVQTHHTYISMKYSGDASPFRTGISVDTVGMTPIELSNQKLICEVTWNDDGSKLLTVRSLVVITNHTIVPIHVRVSNEGAKLDVVLPSIEPGKSFPVPADYANANLWVKPERLGDKGYDWIVDDVVKLHHIDPYITKCHILRSSQEGNNAVLFRAYLTVLKTTDVYSEQDVKIELQLYPPVKIENLLPCTIRQGVVGGQEPTYSIDSGETRHLYLVAPDKTFTITLDGIPGIAGETSHTLFSHDKDGLKPTKKLVIKDPSSKRVVNLFVDFAQQELNDGCRVFTIYSAYWLVNNSQMTLHYKDPSEKSEDAAAVVNSDSNNTALPYLYSHDKLCIRAPDSHWSKPFAIQTVGNQGALELLHNTSPMLYEIKVHIALAYEKFRRTKVVIFVPRFVLVNHMSGKIRFRQQIPKKIEKERDGTKKKTGIHALFAKKDSHSSDGTCPEDKLFDLKAGEMTPFHLPNGKRKRKKLDLQLDDKGNIWMWSRAFLLDQVGEYSVKMRNQNFLTSPSQAYNARVEIVDSDFSTFITFRDEDKNAPPFKLENDTPMGISFQQRDSDMYKELLNAKSSTPYGMDDPIGSTELVVYFGSDTTTPIFCNLSKIKPNKPFKLSNNETVYSFVWVDGSTRVLTFTMDQKRYNKYSKKRDTDLQVSTVESNIVLSLTGFGISVVDNTPKELLYVSVSKIGVEFNQSAVETSFEVIIGDFQIDNQLYSTEFPVLLQSVIKDEEKPFLHISIIKSRLDQVIDYYRYSSVLMQEISVKIEDNMLLNLNNFYTSLPLDQFTKKFYGSSKELYHKYEFKALESGSGGKMIYFKLLLLNPIKMDFTFSLAREGFVHSSSEQGMFILLESVGLSLSKLENAPICINALMMEHPFCSRNALTSRIAKHYTRQIIHQVYKILGSADMLGNPVGLVSNLGTGVVDFFYEPAQGLVKSPKDFGKGLAKGTSSLIKNTVYGTFNTIMKISGTIGKGIASLSMDDDYLRARYLSSRKKPKHIGEGLVMGVQGLGKGLFEGVTGIVRKPVEGAMKDGFEGFAKGMAQGIVGVAVKPVAGVLDFTTRTTEGIRNTTNLMQDKSRVRPPRSFGANRGMKEFALEEATGSLIMAQARKGKYSGDTYVFHKHVTKTHTAVLTDKRLVLCKGGVKHSFDWQVPYEVIKEVLLEREGIAIRVDPPQTLHILDGEQKTILIHIEDESVALVLYTKLGACVKSARIDDKVKTKK